MGIEVVEAYSACSPNTFTQVGAYDYSATQVVGSYSHIHVTPDGLSLYAADTAAGTIPQGISQFSMSSPFDVTTLSFVAHKAESGGRPFGAAFPWGIHFHPDGQRVFFVDVDYTGSGGLSAFVEYTLGTAWDITTLSASPIRTRPTASDFSAQLYELSFSVDGKQLYSGENTSSVVNLHWWTLGTAWDITTASYNGVVNLEDLAGWDAPNNRITSLVIDGTGENMITGNASTFRRISFSTPYDTSTLSYVETYTTTGVTIIYGHIISSDCSSAIISAAAEKKFIGYDLG